MATGDLPLNRINAGKVAAPVAVRPTPALTYINSGKMFTAQTVAPPPPIPRRKTMTIDIRM